MTAAERVAATLAGCVVVTATCGILAADWLTGHIERAVHPVVDDDEIAATIPRIDRINRQRRAALIDKIGRSANERHAVTLDKLADL